MPTPSRSTTRRRDGDGKVRTFRILVTGSRDWEDFYLIRRALGDVLASIDDPSVVITIAHGACPSGADMMASKWIKLIRQDYRYTVIEEKYPADWNRYKKSAGYIRNSEMVKLGADVVLAFIRNGSRGASHTAKIAKDAGLDVVLFTA